MTENVTYAELAYAEEEMQKTYGIPKKCQVEIPEEIKKEFGLHARDFGTALAIKSSLLNIWNILLSEPQLTPGRTSAMTVSDWTVIKRIGRPNLLDSGILK